MAAVVQRQPVERHGRAGRHRRPLELADARLGIEAMPLAHSFDGTGELGQPSRIRLQRRDGRHHVDEPRHVRDQLGSQLRAGREAAEGHVPGHIGRQRRQVGEQPARQECVGIVEHQHAGRPGVLAMPGPVHGAVETPVDLPLDALAARDGELADPVQHRRQLAAPGAVAPLALELLALEHTPEQDGDDRHHRHVDDDQRAREHRGAILPGREVDHPGQPQRVRDVRGKAVEPLHRAAPADQLLRDEQDRGHGAPQPHRQADEAAVKPGRALVDALVDGVRQAAVAADLAPVAHQVEGDAFVGEDLGIKALDQPSARPAMQRGREEMAKRDTGGPAREDRQINPDGRQHGPRRVVRVAAMEFGERGDEVRARHRRPDARLAQQRRHREDDDRQSPGFLPPLGEPVGRGEAPEGAEPRQSVALGHCAL